MVQGQENNAQMLDMMIGNEYGGMISNKNAWGTDRYYATYNPPVNWSGNMFDTSFPQIYTSYFQIKRITEGKGVIMHWANLLRVVGSIRISDCYGPIPYSQITGSEYAVAYDDMPDLYNQMFDDIDDAITGLKEAAASGSSTLYANADYIYQGNFTKWVKFANTIKLRMALRLVNVNPTLAQQKAEEAVNDAYGVITDPSDAAWSSFITQRNPFNLIRTRAYPSTPRRLPLTIAKVTRMSEPVPVFTTTTTMAIAHTLPPQSLISTSRISYSRSPLPNHGLCAPKVLCVAGTWAALLKNYMRKA
jgi:hypothetical protein